MANKPTSNKPNFAKTHQCRIPDCGQWVKPEQPICYTHWLCLPAHARRFIRFSPDGLQREQAIKQAIPLVQERVKAIKIERGQS